MGDQAAKQSGSSHTWTVTTATLAEALDLAEEDLDGLDLTGSLQLDTKGSCDVKGNLVLDLLGDGSQVLTGSLDLTGTTSSSKGSFSLGLKSTETPEEQFALSLSCTQTAKAAATLPGLYPAPRGRGCGFHPINPDRPRRIERKFGYYGSQTSKKTGWTIVGCGCVFIILTKVGLAWPWWPWGWSWAS